MNSDSPPPEAQRYGRSQTPESPRPVHVPEPANIPVLLNQMDPVFNDTATYNIPQNQAFSPVTEQISDGNVHKSAVDDHDAVQTFFREAENQATIEPTVQSDIPESKSLNQPNLFPSVFAPQSVDATPENATSALSGFSDPSHLPQDPPEIAMPQPVPQPQHDAPDLQATAKSHIPSLGVAGEEGDTQMKVIEKLTPSSHEQSSGDKEGVDYQSLLDTITQSASTAPAAEAMTAATTGVELSQSSPIALATVPGLPPKPPPQENPIDFPSYLLSNNTSPQEMGTTNPIMNSGIAQPQALGESLVTSLVTPSSAVDASGTSNEQAVNSNGFTPSLSSQPPTSLAPGQTSPEQDVTSADIQRSQDPAERPWSPRTQTLYDQFLEEERRYVTEGIWDKFPTGSRLFVGNLPSEKVTKRDLYHKFHKHGKLAQISIKQAYGFVQFLEASSCLNALNAEQGVEIRGRKVHLEISKPQKNTRGAGSKANQTQARRRSRSPERNNRRTYSDYRDEPGRRQNEYRNRRSPSPRGYRGRDEFRPGSRDERPRSPIYPPGFVPQQAVYDDEAALPIPRRDLRNVPDVQLLVLEPEVVHSFINWVEQGFRMKGLQASTIWLNPRLPLAAVIKRQIIEGVQAVVKLSRVTQNSSKIPLQVFDRTAGASNVNFNEYVDLDLGVAADIVIQARMRERPSSQSVRSPLYPPQPAYSQPSPYTAQSPSVPYPPPNASQFSPLSSQPFPYSSHAGPYRPPSQPSPTAGSQPPNLQQLLANLRQPSNQQGGSMPSVGQSGLAMPNSHFGQSQYGSVAPTIPSYGQYNAAGSGLPGGSHPSGQSQPNVQNLMDQLARYQR